MTVYSHDEHGGHAAPRSPDGRLIPALIIVAALTILALAFVVSQSYASVGPRVYFITPVDGATVPTTFTVGAGVDGLKLEPAGEIHSGAGHLHILVDTDFIPAGAIIPKDEQHIHLGKGTSSMEITLPPGDHVLRLQFADGAHQALEGDAYRAEIHVTVK
jgi:hypothetical protein